MRALALPLLALLAACTTPEDVAEDAAGAVAPGQTYAAQIADRIAPVSDAHRDVRVCLLGAGFLELGVTKAELVAPWRGTEILGRVVRVQTAVARLRAADPLWRETEMGHAAIAIAGLLGETAAEKARGYLRLGLSVETAVFAGRNLGIDAILGPAVWGDVRRILADLDAGRVGRGDAWAACEGRLLSQQARLGD